MNSTIAVPVGYRLEWKEYIFMTVENYAKEICKDGARVCGLYTEPQPGCDPNPVVYRGRYWVQPKNIYGKTVEDLMKDGFVPLYLGMMLHDGWEAEPSTSVY